MAFDLGEVVWTKEVGWSKCGDPRAQWHWSGTNQRAVIKTAAKNYHCATCGLGIAKGWKHAVVDFVGSCIHYCLSCVRHDRVELSLASSERPPEQPDKYAGMRCCGCGRVAWLCCCTQEGRAA